MYFFFFKKNVNAILILSKTFRFEYDCDFQISNQFTSRFTSPSILEGGGERARRRTLAYLIVNSAVSKVIRVCFGFVLPRPVIG